MRRATLIIVVAAVGLLVVAQQGKADIINNTALAAWSFDSNLSCSNASYNGTTTSSYAVAGNATIPTVSYSDPGSLYLSNTASPGAYVTIPTLTLARTGAGASSLNTSNAWTISLWFKEVGTANNANGMLIGNWTSGGNGMMAVDSSFGLRVRCVGNTSGNSNDFYMTPPTTTWTENTNWHFLVVTENSAGTFTAYLDNTSLPVHNTNASNTVFQFNTIGDYNGNASSMDWDGYIDNLSIWDGAANSTQAGNLYTSGAVPEPATLALLGFGVAGALGLRKRRKA